MTDQANRLRDLMNGRQTMAEKDKPTAPPRVIAISSGKGGVGKSSLAVNLAVQFAKINKRCILVDADFSGGSAPALLGVTPRYSLLDAFEGRKEITEVLESGPLGIGLVSGGAGFSKLTGTGSGKALEDGENIRQISYFVEKIAPLDDISDIILVDTGAGMSNQVVEFIAASSEAVLIITPEAASITDAYAVIKRVKEQSADLPEINVVVNRTEDKFEGDEVFGKLERACNKFLGVKLSNIGCLPTDPNLQNAVKAKQPVSILYPDADIVKSFEHIRDRLTDAKGEKYLTDPGFKVFMHKLIKKFNGN